MLAHILRAERRDHAPNAPTGPNVYEALASRSLTAPECPVLHVSADAVVSHVSVPSGYPQTSHIVPQYVGTAPLLRRSMGA